MIERVCVCVCVCVCACVCVCTCACMCVCVCTHVCVYTSTFNCVYCSNAARASGITVIIKGAEIDEAFSKLLLQAMGQVKVVTLCPCTSCV